MKTTIDDKIHSPIPRSPLLTLSLCIGLLTLAGCNKTDNLPATTTETTSTASAPAPATVDNAPATTGAPVSTYVAPTADQLYQMVAPIALYPDKLVAQLLAAATYPDQVTAAQAWLTQNPSLKAGPLADAVSRQPWDPSIKSLTAFRPVVAQLATNLPWTTALGEAYYNNPSDVLNAIQVMRQRASKAGTLKSNPKQRISSAPAPVYSTSGSSTVVVQRPREYITIEPAQQDLVYVPDYNPRTVYGRDAAYDDHYYPGYRYRSAQDYDPQYGYRQDDQPNHTAELATSGLITFGVGVVVGSAMERHGWGWNSWNTDWRGRDDADRGDGYDGRRRDGARGPVVVYNNSVYESRSNTVINQQNWVQNRDGNGDMHHDRDRYRDRQQPINAKQPNPQPQTQPANQSRPWVGQQWRQGDSGQPNTWQQQQRAEWQRLHPNQPAPQQYPAQPSVNQSSTGQPAPNTPQQGQWRERSGQHGRQPWVNGQQPQAASTPVVVPVVSPNKPPLPPTTQPTQPQTGQPTGWQGHGHHGPRPGQPGTATPTTIPNSGTNAPNVASAPAVTSPTTPTAQPINPQDHHDRGWQRNTPDGTPDRMQQGATVAPVVNPLTLQQQDAQARAHAEQMQQQQAQAQQKQAQQQQAEQAKQQAVARELQAKQQAQQAAEAEQRKQADLARQQQAQERQQAQQAAQAEQRKQADLARQQQERERQQAQQAAQAEQRQQAAQARQQQAQERQARAAQEQRAREAAKHQAAEKPAS